MMRSRNLKTLVSTLLIAALALTSVGSAPVSASAAPSGAEPITFGDSSGGLILSRPAQVGPNVAAQQVGAARAVWTNTACPVITDSISRLYSAYFLRDPDQGGFGYWSGNFSSGDWNLDRMSNFFAESDEFVARYGGLGNGQFVDLVYNNVFGRPADAGGRTHWLGQLDRGEISRGRVMISFSESPEYVAQTATAVPLAGYFNWLPAGSKWHCGYGSADVALQVGTNYVDFVVMNTASVGTATVDVYLHQLGAWNLDASIPLESGWARWVLGARLTQVSHIRVTANEQVAWALVDSPTPTPRDREGWASQV